MGEIVMGENDRKSIKLFGKEIVLGKKLLIIASAVLLAVVVAVVFIVIGTNNKIKATTMRLLKMEGTVTLEENGVAKTVKENLRFKSGDAISTDVGSRAARRGSPRRGGSRRARRRSGGRGSRGSWR